MHGGGRREKRRRMGKRTRYMIITCNLNSLLIFKKIKRRNGNWGGTGEEADCMGLQIDR